MKLLLSGIILFFIFSCSTPEITDEASSSVSLDDIEWLTGNWQDSLRSNQWEIWTKNKFGMRGRGIAVNESDTTQFEELTLVEENGKLVYIANVRGNAAPVKFIGTVIEENLVVFENPQHSFPKYISYRYFPDSESDRLHATVGAGDKMIELFYIRR